MSAADRILGEQDVARTDEEVLPLARLEIERPTQGYDQLPDRRVVPGEGAARSGLLKGDRRRRHFAAQHVAALSGLKLNDALLEMRVSVISRPYPYASYHGPAPGLVASRALRDLGPAAAERGSTGRNGTAVASFQSSPATVSSVNNMSPARSEKGPSCIVNSSAPLSVMTSWRAGSECHPSFASKLVCWKETEAVENLSLSMSPRWPWLKVDDALLECELPSGPLHSLMHRIIVVS
jgi:hypothetical protein